MRTSTAMKSTCASILSACKYFYLSDGSRLNGGNSGCLFCETGSLKSADLTAKACAYSTCPTGMFLSTTNNMCKACHENCSTCFDADKDSCTSCAANSYSYKYSCFQKKCPKGYYVLNETNRICASNHQIV